MIRGSTGRFLTLILAPLLVVGVTAIVMLSRGGTEKIKVSADGPTVSIQTPQADAHLPMGTTIVQADVSDPDGLATAELRVDGKKVGKANLNGGSEEQATFSWEADSAGEHDLAVRARDLNGSWGADAKVHVTVDSNDVALPAPPSTGGSTTGLVPSPGSATVPVDTGTQPTTGLAADPSGVNTTNPTLPLLFPVHTSPAPAPTPAPGTTPTVAPPSPPIGSPVTTPTTIPTVPTLPPTTIPTTIPTTTIPPCVVGTPFITSPAPGSLEVVSPVGVSWLLVAPCPPRALELQVVTSGRNVYQQPVPRVNARIALSGGVRSYSLAVPLPACTTVTLWVISYDESSPGFHRSPARNFVTTSAGCILPPTTTTTSTTTTTTTIDTTTTVDTTTTLPPPPPVT